MKCVLIRDMERMNPEWSAEDKIAAKAEGRPYKVSAILTVPEGTEIEHPDAYRLVQMGVALPVDDDCAEMANMTEEQHRAARQAYARLSKGMGTGLRRHDSQTVVAVTPAAAAEEVAAPTEEPGD